MNDAPINPPVLVHATTAATLRIGHVVYCDGGTGPARRVTLSRLEGAGATARVVLEFADTIGQTYLPLTLSVIVRD